MIAHRPRTTALRFGIIATSQAIPAGLFEREYMSPPSLLRAMTEKESFGET
jgi:hypothetical protein